MRGQIDSWAKPQSLTRCAGAPFTQGSLWAAFHQSVGADTCIRPREHMECSPTHPVRQRILRHRRGGFHIRPYTAITKKQAARLGSLRGKLICLPSYQRPCTDHRSSCRRPSRPCGRSSSPTRRRIPARRPRRCRAAWRPDPRSSRCRRPFRGCP